MLSESIRGWLQQFFDREDGWFVFKSDYMPKKYAMMLLPISGPLIVPFAFIEDVMMNSP